MPRTEPIGNVVFFAKSLFFQIPISFGSGTRDFAIEYGLDIKEPLTNLVSGTLDDDSLLQKNCTVPLINLAFSPPVIARYVKFKGLSYHRYNAGLQYFHVE